MFTIENFIKDLSIELEIFINDSFSLDKKLFEYQKEALINIEKLLIYYFKYKNGNKQEYANSIFHALEEYSKLHIPLNTINFTLEELDILFNISDNKILFDEICNRMSLWMATGSGKTIVIIKLIELLFNLMEENIIPKKEIMFLTYRDDLLKNFRNLIEEYNKNKPLNEQIELFSLKEYETIKNQQSFGKRIFIYRSDLISDKTTENFLNFRDYLTLDNNENLNGNWYLILDEAHKGTIDSKRQIIFSILSKNGFLFNFSATFTEIIDKITTVYNLNLSEFIERGYGKTIFLFKDEIKKFKKQKDFEDFTKRKIILKNFILLTALKKAYFSLNGNYYHNPLLLFLMNSINKKDSDLLLVLEEIGEIARFIDKNLFLKAKEEIIDEFFNNNFIIGNNKSLSQCINLINSLTYLDIYKYVFNSNSNGNIEVKKFNKNNKELILKLDSSNKPFALIKIGDINELLKTKLNNLYKIDEDFEETIYFENLNDKSSSINILLGSRAFYEGWDSNRPNIINFINIGTGDEAKKFVLQSIGRGIRIEPIPGFRKRIEFLDKKTDISYYISTLLETLFIYATNKKAIETILKELETIKTSNEYKKISLKENKHTIPLYCPIYRKYNKKLTIIKNPIRFKISQKNLKELQIILSNMPKLSFLLYFNYSKEEYNLLRQIIFNNSKYILINNDIHFTNIKTLFSKLKDYIKYTHYQLEKFNKINGNTIIHFKNIKILSSKYEDFKEHLLACLETNRKLNFDGVYLEKIINHFYIPLIYTKYKIEWIKNIITEESEVNFLKTLISIQENISKKYVWMFSKINEHYDNIFIPYMKNGKTHKFYPDFIFWLKEKETNNYKIIFIDPKGMSYTDYQEKIEGFKTIFENKIFKTDNLNIKVSLKLFNEDISGKNFSYIEYWCDKNSLEKVFQ